MNNSKFKADNFSMTSAEWSAINPYLAKNDTGVESDTGKKKLGVGLRWNDTDYQLVGTGITSIVAISQTNYDALASKDPNTLYVIT